MMAPKLNSVYRGISGFKDSNVLSCTALGNEDLQTQMIHDLFTGDLVDILY